MYSPYVTSLNYILLLNYNSSQDTINSLARLHTLPQDQYRIAVIDNNSSDNSLNEILNFLKSQNLKYFKHDNHFDDKKAVFLNIISSKKNLGYGGGNNIILKELALKDNCNALIINPDIIVENSVIIQAAKKLNEMKEQKVALGIKALNAQDNKCLFYGGHKINFFSGTVSPITNASEEIDFISGSFLFTNSQTLSEIGLLPENYFMYWEDADWCYQLKKAGGKMITIPELSFLDTQDPTRSSFAQYYYVKNMLKFLKKHRPACLITAIPLIPIRIGLRILRGQFSYAAAQARALFDFMLYPIFHK